MQKISKIVLCSIIIFYFQNSYSQNSELVKIRNLISLSFNDSAKVIVQKKIKSKKINFQDKINLQIEYARILKNISQTDSSIYYLNKVESYYAKQKNINEIFYIYTLKAETYRFLDKRNLTNNNIYKAEKLFNRITNKSYKYYYLNRRLAILAQHYGNINDSLQKCIKIANTIVKDEKKISDKSIIAYTLNEIGFLFFNIDSDIAEPYFTKAYSYAKKSVNKVAFIDVSLTFGRFVQQKRSNFNKAINIYEAALREAKKIKNLWQIQQLYIELRNCRGLKKDFEKAMFYSDSVNFINSEINTYNDNKKYEILENKYIIQNKDKEIANSKKNFILIVGILVLAVIGIAVLFIYNRKIKIKNIELDHLHKEIRFLVSETNHRVNNNLQLISLLISDTLRKNNSEENRKDFIKLSSKVDAIAVLHRHLYNNKNETKNVNLKDYLLEIKNNFDEITKDEKIEIYLDVESLQFDSEKAMYLGLLVTELMINSLKHAFINTQIKKIHLIVGQTSDVLTFVYYDNGERAKGKNINPLLVEQLCMQLNYNYQINTDDGFYFQIIKN